jgi:hypothetical protein
MYSPKTYMTMEVLSEVLAEFEWPAPYTLEDDLPDGIIMAFPNCRLYFDEGFESHMRLMFLPEDTGTDKTLTLGHALQTIRSDPDRAELPPTPPLINDIASSPSVEKVKNGVRDLAMMVLTYLQPCILGDFSWVEKYKANAARSR